jgi:hypothetical protein
VEFVQIIECTTSRFDEVLALELEWLQATAATHTVRRTVVTRDRRDPDRYVLVAFYDSYESAMENSNLPETGDFSARQSALLDAPMVFHDLDVVRDIPGRA